MRPDLYPDLIESGGLLAAIRAAIVGQPTVEINGFGTGAHYAHLAVDRRSAQVFIGASHRMFSFDCWEERTCHAKGRTPEFRQLVAALHAWLLQHRSVEELVSPNPVCEIEWRTGEIQSRDTRGF